MAQKFYFQVESYIYNKKANKNCQRSLRGETSSEGVDYKGETSRNASRKRYF